MKGLRVTAVNDVIANKSVGWRQTLVDLAHGSHPIPGYSHEEREKERRNAKTERKKETKFTEGKEAEKVRHLFKM